MTTPRRNYNLQSIRQDHDMLRQAHGRYKMGMPPREAHLEVASDNSDYRGRSNLGNGGRWVPARRQPS
jgi:hypothetical protein